MAISFLYCRGHYKAKSKRADRLLTPCLKLVTPCAWIQTRKRPAHDRNGMRNLSTIRGQTVNRR